MYANWKLMYTSLWLTNPDTLVLNIYIYYDQLQFTSKIFT